ncbi:MAG: baseplate J/gp47 family protein [Hungatella sp.]|jgi:hypothetical protein|nr:baseplate J/gp47 family protein [Hungatella sp.]
MLPELVLDNEDFEDIMAEARNMIISLYPEWTDFNYHDPGITLIELFSWMKESQQFFLDQISEESREKYLKLLGVRPGTKQPAYALVLVIPDDDITVLEGTKLYAGEICFEARRRKQLIRDDVVCCFSAGNSILQRVNEERMNFGTSFHLFLFGEKPEKGNCFYIGFSHGLPQREPLDIYLELSCDCERKRNPLSSPMTVPLAEIRLQYFNGIDWKNAEGFQDETNGAIVSGHLSFYLPETMKQTEVFGENGYFLRILLEAESYDVPPVLQSISANRIPLIQHKQVIERREQEKFERVLDQVFCSVDTIMALNGRNDLYFNSEGSYYRITDFTKIPNFETGISCFQFKVPEYMGEIESIFIVSTMAEHGESKYLAEGNGFPYQEYRLNNSRVEYESFHIIVRKADGPECYIPWTKVRDFSGSGPEDRHYILDSGNGVLRFGDCIQGLAPEGDIIITSYTETLGRKGNVKAYKINRFDGMEPEDISVYNQDNAAGGEDEESLEESFLRARKELQHSETAVSDTDYERYVMETPGLLLENCKVIPAGLMRQIRNDVDEAEVNIVVRPFSGGEEKGLSDCYKKNILAYLEPYRMVGRKVSLLSPQYITFEVYADIVLWPHYMNAEEKVRGTLKEYFSDLHHEFGATVQYSDLYGIIDMLECVLRINSLNMDVRGTGVLRSKDGTIKLPPNGVVRLGEEKYLFTTGE